MLPLRHSWAFTNHLHLISTSRTRVPPQCSHLACLFLPPLQLQTRVEKGQPHLQWGQCSTTSSTTTTWSITISVTTTNTINSPINCVIVSGSSRPPFFPSNSTASPLVVWAACRIGRFWPPIGVCGCPPPPPPPFTQPTWFFLPSLDLLVVPWCLPMPLGDLAYPLFAILLPTTCKLPQGIFRCCCRFRYHWCRYHRHLRPPLGTRQFCCHCLLLLLLSLRPTLPSVACRFCCQCL